MASSDSIRRAASEIERHLSRVESVAREVMAPAASSRWSDSASRGFQRGDLEPMTEELRAVLRELREIASLLD